MTGTKRLTLTAACIALGVALPMAFHTVPNAGLTFLPMHIPVLLCGLLCGPVYGAVCGAVAPLLSTLLTSMPAPAMLPSMLCELAVYGCVGGLLMLLAKKLPLTVRLYISLIGAMAAGRIVKGLLNALIFQAGKYSLQVWLTGSFAVALPGIIIQLAVIVPLVLLLQKAGLVCLPQQSRPKQKQN